MANVYCGIVKYFEIPFEVQWDTNDKTVHVSMLNNSKFPHINYSDMLANTKEEAIEIAKTALAKALNM